MPFETAAFRLIPKCDSDLQAGQYRLYHREGASTARLFVPLDNGFERFDLHQFHLGRFRHGGRFIADRVGPTADGTGPGAEIASGQITGLTREGRAVVLDMTGKLAGTTVVRPIKIDGRERYLVYRLTT